MGINHSGLHILPNFMTALSRTFYDNQLLLRTVPV